MMRRLACDETFRTASVCAARGATFKTQRQLVAQSLVFDRCRNERGSSTALTSAAVYRRISIPHLGFRYCYRSAAGSLKAGVRVCSGGCREVAAPEGVARLRNSHPDVPIFLGAIDSRLDAQSYIVPGLGDAGDRQFGTG